MAVIEGWPKYRGGHKLKGNVVGTQVSGRYTESDRLSGVAVKRPEGFHCIGIRGRSSCALNMCDYLSFITKPRVLHFGD